MKCLYFRIFPVCIILILSLGSHALVLDIWNYFYLSIPFKIWQFKWFPATSDWLACENFPSLSINIAKMLLPLLENLMTSIIANWLSTGRVPQTTQSIIPYHFFQRLPQNPFEKNSIIISALYVDTWRHKEVKSFIQNFRVSVKAGSPTL